MGGTGIFGALASGYTEAAKARRDQNLALGEHQRDLQIGLLDKLLSDPSTPEEYKGTLLQQRIATTNANQYDKNGILKLPSLDDMRQQLPPVQRPSTPGPSAMPPVQLGVPQPPPGMDTGSQGPPSASLPASGIQKPAGSASVPPALQPASPVTLPSTPLTMPSPPPIAEAGQFHPLTHEEQVQREVARAVAHRDALFAAGIDPARAAVAAGLAPTPTLHNVLPGAGVVDQFGHVIIAPGTKPIGSPVKVANDDGTFSLVQGYLAPDGSKIFKPVDTPGGTSIIPPTPFAPTERTSTTSDEFGTKSTTTSRTQKVMPGGSKSTTTKPTAPVSTETSTGGGTSGGNPSPTTMREGTKKIADDAIKAATDTRKLVNLLDTATDYMNGIQSGKTKPDSAKDLGLIVQAVRSMNPGTVRLPNLEISLERERGTVAERVQRWYKREFGDGTLPTQYRNELFGVIRDETTTSAKDAAANWQQTFGNKKTLPPHLQRFAATSAKQNTGAVVLPPLSPEAQKIKDRILGNKQ